MIFAIDDEIDEMDRTRMILVCQNCGAEFYDDDYVISGFCPDCGIGKLM